MRPSLPAKPLAGRIALANNAGVAPFATVEDTIEAVFDALTRVNMRSLFLVAQRAIARRPDGGRIVNASSVVTRTYLVGIPAYAATKGVVDVLTQQMAGAFAARRIMVNAVAPDAIDTRMSAWIHQPCGADALAAMQALPGIGQPAHVAGVVAFLVGPDAAWTTGQVVHASGGTKLSAMAIASPASRTSRRADGARRRRRRPCPRRHRGEPAGSRARSDAGRAPFAVGLR